MKNVTKNLNKKQLILLFLNIVLVLAFIVVNAFAHSSVKKLFSQQEAKRWEGKNNSYAQVSAFCSPERQMQETDILNIRSAIQQTLSRDALNETNGNARVWIDAYSGECKAEVRRDNKTLSVTAVGVGGEFFQFHPSLLLSGGYISEEDTNHDRVVIDQGLAWAMFGSNDVVGMQLWMGNSIYVVAGVIKVEEDDLTQVAYGNVNRIYVPYDQLKNQQENLMITCYEAVIPNPISNYAANTLKEACGIELQAEQENQDNENPLNFDNIEVIENSNRFDEITLLGKIEGLRLHTMRANSIVYPYWENVARVVEEQQIRLLIIKIILLIIPCLSLICWLYNLWIHKSWTIRDRMVWIIEKFREKQELDEKESSLEINDLECDESEETDSEPALLAVTTEDIFNV